MSPCHLLLLDPELVYEVDVVVGGETMTGISFFGLSAQSRIVQVIDHWPKPYEPPARVCEDFERY